jgi:hypothetical protein
MEPLLFIMLNNEFAYADGIPFIFMKCAVISALLTEFVETSRRLHVHVSFWSHCQEAYVR